MQGGDVLAHNGDGLAARARAPAALSSPSPRSPGNVSGQNLAGVEASQQEQEGFDAFVDRLKGVQISGVAMEGGAGLDGDESARRLSMASEIAQAREAVAQSPGDAVAWELLAAALCECYDWTSALEVSVSPHHPVTEVSHKATEAARIEYCDGMSALETYVLARARAPGVKPSLEMAYLQNEARPWLQAYLRAIDLRKESKTECNAQAYIRVGLIYETLQDVSRAREMYRACCDLPGGQIARCVCAGVCERAPACLRCILTRLYLCVCVI